MLQIATQALRLAAAAAVAVLLAGCVINSENEIIGDAEAVPALPDEMVLYPYERPSRSDAVPTYRVETGEPMGFTREANTYVSADGKMRVRMVPLDGQPDRYLAAIQSEDGYVYALAGFRDSILSLDVALVDPDPSAVLASAQSAAGASPELAGVSVIRGGIIVNSRAQLEAVLDLARAGTLSLATMILYAAPDAQTPPPATIIAEGDFFRAQ